MSVPSGMAKNGADSELDWVLLRQQLDEEREKDTFVPPYKKSWLVKLGVTATALSFGYALFNMNNSKKMIRGASSRIMFQFLTIVVFGVGYYDYTKSPEYAERKNKRW
ncbi:uncharacterized protein LOC135833823 [Planococcus citri]|uniref:uncharacterized protein LOC135833823 n=1 Tax=Planococcus citri TaxID=170843 RepID=UPI0031F7AEEF